MESTEVIGKQREIKIGRLGKIRQKLLSRAKKLGKRSKDVKKSRTDRTIFKTKGQVWDVYGCACV